MAAPLKRRVPFHVARAAAVALLSVLIVGTVLLRGENTRTQVGSLKNNIANRCVQGDDGACRKLLDRLLAVSKLKQHSQLQQIVNGAKGGGASQSPNQGQQLPGGSP